MAQSAVPSSILELLTYPNPTVVQLKPKSNTNTRGNNYHFPKQVKRWVELEDFNIIEHVFEGQLMVAARRSDRLLPPYPTVRPESEDIVRTEAQTEKLITKWNQEVVSAGLDPIQCEFSPVIWCKGDCPPKSEGLSPPSPPSPTPSKKRIQPARKIAPVRKVKQNGTYRLNSDSGSIAWKSTPIDPSSEQDPYRQERFPKEYKVARKWKSQWMFERKLIDSDGYWTYGSLTKNLAWPVRQAFTYCVQHMCRYGCILTTEEAFIFRVRPLDKMPNDASASQLRSCLMYNGLLEYISIPWDNHCRGGLENHREWTINLGLWFMHILAGNQFAVDWEYSMLKEEKKAAQAALEDPPVPGSSSSLGQADQGSDNEVRDGESTSRDSDESDTTLPFNISPAGKRKRSPEETDDYQLSFDDKRSM